jgi:hypothetical protein
MSFSSVSLSVSASKSVLNNALLSIMLQSLRSSSDLIRGVALSNSWEHIRATALLDRSENDVLIRGAANLRNPRELSSVILVLERGEDGEVIGLDAP